MNKPQEAILARLEANVVDALAAIDAAAENVIVQAVRLRAGYDAVSGASPDPSGAIRAAHTAVADYLRNTAAEQDEAADEA